MQVTQSVVVDVTIRVVGSAAASGLAMDLVVGQASSMVDLLMGGTGRGDHAEDVEKRIGVSLSQSRLEAPVTETLSDSAPVRKVTKDIDVQFAQKAVIFKGDRVLLVRKSADDPQQPFRWELPGGRMKAAEDVDEHIRREVFEEVGLRVEPCELVDMWSWEMSVKSDKRVRVVAVARRCLVSSGQETLAFNDRNDHISSLEWYPINKLAELDVIPSQRVVFKKIATTSRYTDVGLTPSLAPLHASLNLIYDAVAGMIQRLVFRL